jgi:uncharacterized protein
VVPRRLPPSPRPAGPVSRRLLGALAGAAALAVSACQLDSRFLYAPTPMSESAWRAIAKRTGAEPVEIARDGVVLRGWFVAPPAVRAAQDAGAVMPMPVVIYYGGNGEEISWMLAEVGRLEGHALLAVSYRGYGASTGRPHEQALYDDALAVYDHFVARRDVDATRIVLWGRSLGSGVATWVASQRPVSAVVLTTPFDSIEALAKLHFPAIAFLLGQRYDSLARVGAIEAPLLAIVAARDTIVPQAHSRRLIEAWAGPVRVVNLPAATHNDLQSFPEHWREVGTFLARR